MTDTQYEAKDVIDNTEALGKVWSQVSMPPEAGGESGIDPE